MAWFSSLLLEKWKVIDNPWHYRLEAAIIELKYHPYFLELINWVFVCIEILPLPRKAKCLGYLGIFLQFIQDSSVWYSRAYKKIISLCTFLLCVIQTVISWILLCLALLRFSRNDFALLKILFIFCRISLEVWGRRWGWLLRFHGNQCRG